MSSLEVNTNYVIKSKRETFNKIDARWVDTPSLFIDITAVHMDEDNRQNRHLYALMCRDRHYCELEYLVLSIYSRWQVI